MKTALIATSDNSSHLIKELPYLLKKAGFHITVVAFPHWSLTNSSFIDKFINAPLDAKSVLNLIVNTIKASNKPFDLIILGTDKLIWALFDSHLPISIKEQLSPIANLNHIKALSGKTEVAELCKKIQILSPPSLTARNKKEALEASSVLGFPVLLKISRSGAGEGVFKCETTNELEEAPICTKQPFLVEKYLEGDLISVEPLFLQSHLVAYSYSIMTYSAKPFQPSLQRTFMPYPAIEPILQKLGKELQMTGFANISFVREKISQNHYLFELDFRPNRWIRYGSFVGVDWSKALKEPDPQNPQRPQIKKQLRLFPSDLVNAIKTKNLSRTLYWLLNRNNTWKALPFYDRKIFFAGIRYVVKKLAKKLYFSISIQKQIQ